MPRLGENSSDRKTMKLMMMTMLGPVGIWLMLLLINTPDILAIVLNRQAMMIMIWSWLVHCLAATPGAMMSALIKITPTVCRPMTMVKTNSRVSKNSRLLTGKPNVFMKFRSKLMPLNSLKHNVVMRIIPIKQIFKMMTSMSSMLAALPNKNESRPD